MRLAPLLLLLGLASTAAVAPGAPPDSLLARATRALAEQHVSAAESLALAALPELERAHGASDARVGDALDLVLEARVRGIRRPGVDAESLAARAVAIRRGSADSAALGRTLLWSGRLQAVRALPRAGRAQLEEGLRLTRVHAPRDSSTLDALELALGSVCLPLVDVESSERYFRDALTIEEQRWGTNHPSSAFAWLGIGILATFAGDHAGGRKDLEHALGLVERQTPPDPATLTSILNNLTRACTETGEWTDARRYGDRALAAADSIYGSDHPNTAKAHANLSDALACLGDFSEALEHARRAVAVHRTVSRSNIDLAKALGMCGEIFYDTSVLDSAAVYLRASHDMFQELLGPDHPVVLHGRGRVAVVESERGHPARALGWLESLRTRVAGEDPRWRLEMDRALAQVHRSLGHRAAAESLYRQVAVAHDRLEGPRSPFTLSFRGLHAACLVDLGDRVAAFAEARDIQRISRDVLSEAAVGLSDREGQDFADEIARGTDVLMSLAADSIGLPPVDRIAAWDAVCRSRLAVLDERAERRRILRAAGPAVTARQAALSAARDSLARLVALELESGGADPRLANRIRRACLARESAERALGETSPAYRGARASRARGIAEAIAALPPGAGLVGFVRYAHQRPPVAADSGMGRASELRYAALVRSPGAGEVKVVALGPGRGLDDLVARWLERSAHPIPASDTLSWRRYRELGAEVRRQLWDPVLAKLAGAERIVVVPDGALTTLNWLALPAEGGGWLAESGPLIEVRMSERDRTPDAGVTVTGRGLLALADPAFDLAPPSELLVASREGRLRSVVHHGDAPELAPLPESIEEAREISELWARRGAGGEATLLTGVRASEEAFKREAPGKRVLHLATHAVSLAGRNVEIRAGVRSVGGLHAGPNPAPLETREDLAALALAGAARADSGSDHEDGWLTSEEVLSLDLSGVEWAVLSACQTGLGDARARESVQGLVRSFRLAGAGTVIASLWPVDDRATREWMTDVYRARWVEGLGTAEAIRAASREVIAARRARGESTHPFYWAAFVPFSE